MYTKLTLRLDKDVIEQAKEYAREHGTSLSNMIERYLKLVSATETYEEEISPLVKSLTGVIPPMSDEEFRESYIEYLTEKHK